MHANPMLHDGAWVGADNSSLQGSPPHAEFCAIITCTLLDCILYLMQYPYDPGTLLSSANYCTPGKVYLYPIHQGIITCTLDSSSVQPLYYALQTTVPLGKCICIQSIKD